MELREDRGLGAALVYHEFPDPGSTEDTGVDMPDWDVSGIPP